MKKLDYSIFISEETPWTKAKRKDSMGHYIVKCYSLLSLRMNANNRNGIITPDKYCHHLKNWLDTIEDLIIPSSSLDDSKLPLTNAKKVLNSYFDINKNLEIEYSSSAKSFHKVPYQQLKEKSKSEFFDYYILLTTFDRWIDKINSKKANSISFTIYIDDKINDTMQTIIKDNLQNDLSLIFYRASIEKKCSVKISDNLNIFDSIFVFNRFLANIPRNIYYSDHNFKEYKRIITRNTYNFNIYKL
ncbi:hypothetical protein [Enterococcus faecalis]|uniref:hypothetical protein n=1 Tax=Enterococcus faecalis TaxID=1351 RepID=UPI0039A5DF00